MNANQKEDKQNELPKEITQELLQKSSGYLDQFFSQLVRINLAVVLIRLFAQVVLGSDIPLQMIVGPLGGVIFCILQKTVKKDTVFKFNLINSAFKMIITISFIEIIKSKKGEAIVLFYVVTFTKINFIFDQVQVFPQKYQQLQTAAIFLFLIVRNANDDFLFGYTITHLSVIFGGLAGEYYSTKNFEGINQYLIKKLFQIQKLESRWSNLLKHLKVGISTFSSTDNSLIFCNEAMLSIFQIENTSLQEIQNNLASITMVMKLNSEKKEFSFAEFLAKKIEESIRNELIADDTFTMKLKNSKKVIEISFQYCQDEEKSILVMVNEITSLKKLEKQKQIDRMKTIYFCSVAHDLKTPINSIQATNHYLSHKFKEDQGTIRLINVISTSCQFLIRTIQDITDLSKIELKQFDLDHQWFDISELISEVREVMSLPFEMKKISLDIKDLEQIHLGRFIYCDSKRIKQILLNLIGNALKFTLQGGVTVSMKLMDMPEDSGVERRGPVEEQKVDQGIQEIDKMLLFKVTDTGIGIKEENMAQLFKLFGKVREQSDINKQGIGLGLTICKRLTELLGGQIQVKSEYEKGTQFAFSVKCRIKHSQEDEDFKAFTTFSDLELDSYRQGVEKYLQSFLYEKSILNIVSKQE